MSEPVKAPDPDPDRSLALCRTLGATDEGVLHQRDTYYATRDGQRLKLREQQPGAARLIHYDRADEPQQRESRYRIVDVADVSGLHAVLVAVLGVECVVAKRRHLLLWRGVRIHLDEVEGAWFVHRAGSGRPQQTPTCRPSTRSSRRSAELSGSTLGSARCSRRSTEPNATRTERRST